MNPVFNETLHKTKNPMSWQDTKYLYRPIYSIISGNLKRHWPTKFCYMEVSFISSTSSLFHTLISHSFHKKSVSGFCIQNFFRCIVLKKPLYYLLTFLNLLPAWWKLLHLCMVIWWGFRKAIIGCSRFQRHYTYLQSSNNVLCATLHWWECKQMEQVNDPCSLIQEPQWYWQVWYNSKIMLRFYL